MLQALVPLYIEVLQELAEAGAGWIQIDEPILVKQFDKKRWPYLMKCIKRFIMQFRM